MKTPDLIITDPFPFNILVFGSSGYGKSSFVLSSVTCFQSDIDKETGPRTRESGENEQKTTRYERFKILDNLYMWDCVGQETSVVNLSLFKQMLSGEIEDKTELKAGYKTIPSNPNYVIHAVLFVISATEMSQKSLQYLKEFYLFAKKMDKYVQFIVTKVDQLEEFSKYDNIVDISYEKVCNNKVVGQTLPSELKKVFEVSEAPSTMPMINYTHQTGKLELIQKLSENIFTKIFKYWKTSTEKEQKKVEFGFNFFENEQPCELKYNQSK